MTSDDVDPFANGVDGVTVRPTSACLRNHPLPPLDNIGLPERLHNFPRTNHQERFGYPFYLFEEGHWEWKLRWACRAASHAWTRAIAENDISLVIPPRERAKTPQGTERQVLLEESLCLAVVDKCLDINAWARKVRSMYEVRNLTFDEWVNCDLGRDEIASWATRFIDDRLQAHFPDETWILETDGLEELAQCVCEYALNTVYEVLYDSMDQLEPPIDPFPLSYLEKWFPDPEDVPPERIVLANADEDDDDFGTVYETGDDYVDLDGNWCDPDEDMERIERWEREWASPELEPLVEPKLPSLADWWEAKAKQDAKEKTAAEEEAAVSRMH